VVAAGLAAGANFGIPALMGPTGPMAISEGTPYVAPTMVPIGADLTDTTAPLSTAAVPSKVPTETTAKSALVLEKASVSKISNGIRQGCDALDYSSPVTDADVSSADPLQILPAYASNDVVITAVARQFPSVETANQQQAGLTKMINNCTHDSGAAVGTITVAPSNLEVNYAPVVSVGWTSTVYGTKGDGIIQEVEERMGNRTVRVTCIENTTNPSAAVEAACAHELLSVSQILSAAKPG
jgi:hypothetical protein